MTLIEFKERAIILNATEGDRLRKTYIHKFININQEDYHEQIEVLHKFVDGYCYEGYLWDYIKNPMVIDENYIKKIKKNNGGICICILGCPFM